VAALVAGCSTSPATTWDGELDEVRIWSTVRTAAEIDALRLVEARGDESGLVAAWHFDGNYDDATSNAATLTPTPANVPVFSKDTPF